MISFEIETATSGEFEFVDRLIVSVGDVVFGECGTPSLKGPVVDAVESLIENIHKQQQFHGLLEYFSAKTMDDLFAVIDDACWGTGKWDWGSLNGPSNPYIFLALPTGIELFDAERAYFLGSPANLSLIVYRNIKNGLIESVEVGLSEYLDAWRAVLAQLKRA